MSITSDPALVPCPVCGHLLPPSLNCTCSECGARVEYRPYSPDQFLGGLRAAWLLTIFATLVGFATLGMQSQIDRVSGDLAASRSHFSDLSNSVASIQLQYIAVRRNGLEHSESTADFEEALAASRTLATSALATAPASSAITIRSMMAKLPLIVFYTVAPALIAISLVGRKAGVYSKNLSRLIGTCVIAYALVALMHAHYAAWA